MKLKTYLETKGITAAAFGALVGVNNKQTISRYIRGDRFPPADMLLRIREATDGTVTADDFVDQHVSATHPAQPQPASAL